MIDETQGQVPEEPTTGQETSMGGASEWSPVEPPQQPPANVISSAPPAAVYPPPELEPLPQPLPPEAASAPPPPGAHLPSSTGPGYQPVYGSEPAPQSYASGPNYPPPGTPGMPPPPPGYGAPGGPGYTPPPPGGQAGPGLSSHAAAAIAYLTFIPAVIFLVMAPYNRDRFVRFHAWQCIALTVVVFVIAILFSVLGIVGFHMLWWMFHSLIDLVLFVFWLIAIIKASQGQWYRIPIVGDLAENFAGKA